MVNYIKYLNLSWIIMVLTNCSNYSHQDLDVQKNIKANVKLYLGGCNLHYCEAILIINDSVYYVLGGKSDKFIKYKYKDISYKLKDTITRLNQHNLKLDFSYCSLIDSAFFDVKKDIIIDSLIQQHYEAGFISWLFYDNSNIRYESYRCLKNEINFKVKLDTSRIIAINYLWKLFEKENFESDINPSNTIVVSFINKKNNVFGYSFGNRSRMLYLFNKILEVY